MLTRLVVVLVNRHVCRGNEVSLWLVLLEGEFKRFFFSFCSRVQEKRWHLKAIKSGFCLITRGSFFPLKPVKLASPLRTPVSPCGMARNQQWEINKWPLKNITALVRIHLRSGKSSHVNSILSHFLCFLHYDTPVWWSRGTCDPTGPRATPPSIGVASPASLVHYWRTHQSAFITPPNVWMNCPPQMQWTHN